MWPRWHLDVGSKAGSHSTHLELPQPLSCQDCIEHALRSLRLGTMIFPLRKALTRFGLPRYRLPDGGQTTSLVSWRKRAGGFLLGMEKMWCDSSWGKQRSSARPS